MSTKQLLINTNEDSDLPYKGELRFKRWNGVLLLVVELPDGSPGTIRADATDVFGGGGPQGAVSVLDAAGLRELHRLVWRLCASRVAEIADKAQVGSPRP